MGRKSAKNSLKQHRIAQPFGAKVEKEVSQFLTNAGLGGYRKWEGFWTVLRSRYGPIADKLIDAVKARAAGEGSSDVYALKNHSLDLSLDLCSQYHGRLYAEFASWLLREHFPAPRRIVDLGCDCGVLTCFYATMWPDSEVWGFDSCTEAIRCARELAARLGVHNVRFCNADALEITSVDCGGPADLVICTTSLHEIVTDLGKWDYEPRVFSMGEVAIRPEDRSVLKRLSRIVDLVDREAGYLITMERFASSKEICYFVKLISEVGCEVDFVRSYFISYEDPDRKTACLPIIVARRSCENNTASDPHAALAFCAYRELNKQTDRLSYNGDVAEALFVALSSRDLLLGVEARYNDGSGIARYELWQAGPLCLLYKYTNLGYRELLIQSGIVANELDPSLQEFANSTSEHAEIEFYDSNRLRQTPTTTG